jgi:Amt family ammonium transporter
VSHEKARGLVTMAWPCLFDCDVSSLVCAETAPYVTTVDKISAGDTAWMLTSTAFVLLMTIPGLALFYSGMVRKKNVLATSTYKVLLFVRLVTVVWVVIGYSLAFTPALPLILAV